MSIYIKGLFQNLANPAVSLFTLIDTKSRVNHKAKIYRFARIVDSSIGRYSYIGINSWIVNAEVGQFCSIATDVNIGLAEHTIDYLSTSPIFTEKINGTGYSWVKQNLINPTPRTYIGNDVWIGYRALIKSGIKIGNGAIVGAGAVVTKNIPPYAIVAGVPAKIIRYRYSQKVIDRLGKLNWWEMDELLLQKNIDLFQRNAEAQIDDIIERLELPL